MSHSFSLVYHEFLVPHVRKGLKLRSILLLNLTFLPAMLICQGHFEPSFSPFSDLNYLWKLIFGIMESPILLINHSHLIKSLQFWLNACDVRWHKCKIVVLISNKHLELRGWDLRCTLVLRLIMLRSLVLRLKDWRNFLRNICGLEGLDWSLISHEIGSGGNSTSVTLSWLLWEFQILVWLVVILLLSDRITVSGDLLSRWGLRQRGWLLTCYVERLRDSVCPYICTFVHLLALHWNKFYLFLFTLWKATLKLLHGVLGFWGFVFLRLFIVFIFLFQ